MFGSSRVQGLESQIRDLKAKLDREMKEKEEVLKKLQDAEQKITTLETKKVNTDLESLKEETRSAKAEFEGLKALYVQKKQEFDATREEKEEAFAREAALDRYNLQHEIEENREANQEFVTNTIKTFSESYNYYLNQIKLLMDALGEVATQTGNNLFSQENGDLKAKFGLKMVEALRSGTDTIPHDTGDLILIGSQEEAPAEDAFLWDESAAESPAKEAPAKESPAEEPASKEKAEKNATENVEETEQAVGSWTEDILEDP